MPLTHSLLIMLMLMVSTVPSVKMALAVAVRLDRLLPLRSIPVRNHQGC